MAVLLAAVIASAAVKAWDQEQVTALAGELHQKTRELRDSVRRVPPPTLGQPGQNAFHRLRDELGAIETTAGRLHNALAEGATREETFPTYRRLLRAVRSAVEEVPRLGGTRKGVEGMEVAEVLARLQEYYEAGPL